MAAHIHELEEASPEILEELLDQYYVPRLENRTPIDSILEWLTPEPGPFGKDALQSIKEGLRFSGWNDDLSALIFQEKIPVSSVVIQDFAEHPMRAAFGYNPWDLLNGYILAPDRPRYFSEITGKPSEDFLNETERIFYLTRGYGRPNNYISPTDLKLRKFYMKASPTALIALSDILGLCPTQQDPREVLEALSDVDLRTIDQFHQNTVQKITECLDPGRNPGFSKTLGSSRLCRTDEITYTAPLTCPKCVTRSVGLRDCNPDALSCFEQFLRSIGALSTVEYNPETNSFLSGISQLELYREVIPEKKWSYQEVKEMPNVYIKSILRRLPDVELLKVLTPYGEQNIRPYNLSGRLRENLLKNSYKFLTDKRYFSLNGGRLGFGRAVDSKLQEMTLEDLKKSIIEKDALIDPYENPVSPEIAEMLLDDPEIRRIILKTRSLELDNQEYLTELPEDEKEKFKQGIQRGISSEDLGSALKELFEDSPAEFRRLLLWAEQNGEWIPLGMDFDKYLQEWSPRFTEIIKQTMKYYLQTL